jgi:hypothetical protein
MLEDFRPAKGAAAVIGAQPAKCSLALSSIDDALNLLDRPRGDRINRRRLDCSCSSRFFPAISRELLISESRRYEADEGGEA